MTLTNSPHHGAQKAKIISKPNPKTMANLACTGRLLAAADCFGDGALVPGGVGGAADPEGLGEPGGERVGGVPGDVGGELVATTSISTFMPEAQCPGVPQMKYLFPVEFSEMTVFPPV